MSNLNQVQLIGRVGKQPEIISSEGKKPFAAFSIATNDKFKRNDEIVTETEWHQIVLFGGLVGVVEKYVSSGDLIFVQGKLKHQKWHDKEGNERLSTQIIAKELQLLSGNKKGKVVEDTDWSAE